MEPKFSPGNRVRVRDGRAPLLGTVRMCVHGVREILVILERGGYFYESDLELMIPPDNSEYDEYDEIIAAQEIYDNLGL